MFDFVGADPTIALGAATVAQRGSLTVVGIAGGEFAWNFFAVPCRWASRPPTGAPSRNSTRWSPCTVPARLSRRSKYTLDNALEAYEKLRDGKLSARAPSSPRTPDS